MRSVHRQARRGTAVAAGAPAGVPPAALPELSEGTLACRVAGTTLERQWHEAVRAAVFVHEQGLFAGTDLDSWDADPATVKVIGLAGGRPAGAVRLYPLPEPGEWKGDRLAVLPAWRKAGLGAPLVRFAVRSAGLLGGDRMVAMVQPANVPFFVRLGWEPVGAERDYVGVPHQEMAVALH